MASKKENQHYDLTYIRNLSGDDEFVLMLMELLLSSKDENLELIERAYNDKNLKELGVIVHKLRSSIQHFKMDKLDQYLKEIEKQCLADNPEPGFDDLIKEMMFFYAAVMKEIELECVNLANSIHKA